MNSPKNVKIVKSEQKGEWQQFTGIVDNKQVSVDIHRKDLDKSRAETEGLIKRSLLGTANLPPDAHREGQ